MFHGSSWTAGFKERSSFIGPGIKTFKKIEVNVPGRIKLKLFNMTLKPGLNVLDLSRIGLRYVEFRSAADVADAKGIELHFRSDLPIGTFSRDLDILFK